MTLEGYFLDCLAGLRSVGPAHAAEMDGTFWGPLLDQASPSTSTAGGIIWRRATWRPLDEAYPRLLRFADYLESIRDKDGLLPVENLGIPQVWMDHIAYQQQRHKQCAFNLYAAAMLEHALAPLARARGDRRGPTSSPAAAGDLLAATVRKFWSPERGLFVNNLPWLAEEKGSAALRPLAGDGHPVRSVSGWQHGRIAVGAGRMPAGDGPFLSVQRLLALLGLGPARAGPTWWSAISASAGQR